MGDGLACFTGDGDAHQTNGIDQEGCHLSADEFRCSTVISAGRTTKVRWRRDLCTVLAVFAVSVLSSCGEGYVVEPAIINVSETSDESKAQLLATVSSFLKQEGFDNLGRSDQMIALLQQQPASKGNTELIGRYTRLITFLTPAEDLRVEWIDYVDSAPPPGFLHYVPSSDHFVELSIFESRPGGFSAQRKQFFDRFLQALRQDYGDAVVVAKEPPPNDEATYRRITIGNTIASGFWLSFTALISLLTIGSLSVYVLKKIPLSRLARRILFVAVNFWLVAPMPVPVTITEIPVPNIFLFPWTDIQYYHHIARIAVWSLSCTLLLCAAVSMFLFRSTGRIESAA
jgi:hypothetical protein